MDSKQPGVDELLERAVEMAGIFARVSGDPLAARMNALSEVLELVLMTPGWRWVERNHDKPHRCPVCHGSATYDRKRVGPRTKVRCVNGCRVQWRIPGHIPYQHPKSKSHRQRMWYGWHRDERRS